MFPLKKMTCKVFEGALHLDWLPNFVILTTNHHEEDARYSQPPLIGAECVQSHCESQVSETKPGR